MLQQEQLLIQEAEERIDKEISGLSNWDANKLMTLSELPVEVVNGFFKVQHDYAAQEIRRIINARNLNQLGEAHLIKQRFSKSLKYFLLAIKEDSEFLPSYFKAIFCCVALKNFKKGEDLYKVLLAKTNNRSSILHDYILFRFQLLGVEPQTLSEIIRDIKILAEKEPEDPNVINTLGFVLLNLKKDFKGAETQFEKVLDLAPLHSHAQNNLGVCYLNMGLVERAVSCFRKAIASNRQYAMAYENLAFYFLKNGDFKNTLDTLQEAKQNQVKLSHNAEHTYGWMLIKNLKFLEAEEWYRNKLLEEPDNYLLYINLGFCLGVLKNTSLAKGCLKEAIRQIKKIAKKSKIIDIRAKLAFCNLGRLAIQTEKIKLLEEAIQGLEKFFKNDVFILYLRGYLAFFNNDFSLAADYFQSVISSKVRVNDVYGIYAFLLSVIEDRHKDAVELLTRAKNEGLSNEIIDNNLAFSLIHLGRLEEARRIIDEYAVADDGFIKATEGLLELRLGNLERAKELYTASYAFLRGKQRVMTEANFLLEQIEFFAKQGNKEKVTKLLHELKIPNEIKILDNKAKKVLALAADLLSVNP